MERNSFLIMLAMFFVYNLFLITLAILLSPVVAAAFAIQPKLRAGFFKKMGLYPEKEHLKTPSIWIHAVSVGEINAVEGLVKRIKAEFAENNPDEFSAKNFVDWTNKFENYPTIEETKQFINEFARSGKIIPALSKGWFIDVANKSRKRDHLIKSSKFNRMSKSQKKRHRRYLCELDDLIKNSEYVNSLPNKKPDKKPNIVKYHYFKTGIKVDGKLFETILITEQFKDEQETSPQIVHLFDVIENKAVPSWGANALPSVENPLEGTNNNITDNKANFNPKTCYNNANFNPVHPIVVTTVTRTGQEVARKKLDGIADVISYFPYDFSFATQAAIKAFNPALVIIAETEIWPRFVYEVNRKSIPLMLVNGRISPNSFKGYSKARLFFRHVLDKFNLILMQTQADAERIIKIGKIGAPKDIVQVMGNLKFDISTKLEEGAVENLKKSLNIGDNRVLIAGSTHRGEDEIVLDVFGRLKTEFNDLKLLLAPRHPERNEAVLKLIKASGYPCGRRSEKAGFDSSDIILLDTMGELGQLYSVSHLAFIGGGFSGTGGHNPLEPAIYGVPVLSGPTVFNFKDIFAFMTASGAAKLVNNSDELHVQLKDYLLNDDKYNKTSRACLEIFEKNSGATDYAIQKIKEFV